MKSALLRMQAARNGSSENFQDFNPAENDPKMQDFTFGRGRLVEILSPISRHEKDNLTLSRICDGIVMMDLYPQAKLLSFSSGEVSAKNSKKRRNHTGEKSPLRGDKFNFSARTKSGNKKHTETADVPSHHHRNCATVMIASLLVAFLSL